MSKSNKKSLADRSFELDKGSKGFIRSLVRATAKSSLATISTLTPSDKSQFAVLRYAKNGLEETADIEVRYQLHGDTCSVSILDLPKDVAPLALLHGHFRDGDFTPIEKPLGDAVALDPASDQTNIDAVGWSYDQAEFCVGLGASPADGALSASDGNEGEDGATDGACQLSWDDDGTVRVAVDLGEYGPAAAVVVVEYVDDDGCTHNIRNPFMVSHPEADGIYSGTTKLARPKNIKTGKIVVRPLQADERHLLPNTSAGEHVSAKTEFLANETFAARACKLEDDGTVRFENLPLNIFSQDIALQAVVEDSRDTAAPFDLNEKLGELAENFSPELFTDIWLELQPKLWSLILSQCKDADLTEEVVQEVGIKIGCRWPEIVNNGQNLKGLVNTIAINELRRQLRRRKRTATVASEIDKEDSDFLANIAQNDERENDRSVEVERCGYYMHRLLDREHICFYMNKVEGASVRVIEETLGIGENEVNSALRTAKLKIKLLKAIDWLRSEAAEDELLATESVELLSDKERDLLDRCLIQSSNLKRTIDEKLAYEFGLSVKSARNLLNHAILKAKAAAAIVELASGPEWMKETQTQILRFDQSEFLRDVVFRNIAPDKAGVRFGITATEATSLCEQLGCMIHGQILVTPWKRRSGPLKKTGNLLLQDRVILGKQTADVLVGQMRVEEKDREELEKLVPRVKAIWNQADTLVPPHFRPDTCIDSVEENSTV